MNILLIYPPFCTPSMMPYSLAYLKSFLEQNCQAEIKVLDLNAKFHRLRFPKQYQELQRSMSSEEYAQLLTTFDKLSRPIYAENNKKVIRNELPDHFADMVRHIEEQYPDVVAISFVYNSQGFYGKCLVDALREKGILCVVGGPAVTNTIKKMTVHLKNEIEMLQFLKKQGIVTKEQHTTIIPDFSSFYQEDYLSKERIIPLKTSSTCFYKQCTFCTHFAQVPYAEYDLDNIRQTVLQANAKYVYLIDDMISKERLIALANLFSHLDVKWLCQLRPTKDILGILPQLYAGGLRVVSWGVESGSQRILDLMQKGTEIDSIQNILRESHAAGIKNMVHIMFAFPMETKEEFLETIGLIDKNKVYIDIVMTCIFGLQKGAKVYKHPAQYGIIQVTEKQRTVLDPSISYTISTGLHNEEARVLQKKYQRCIDRINKLPKIYNYFKEQTLLI